MTPKEELLAFYSSERAKLDEALTGWEKETDPQLAILFGAENPFRVKFYATNLKRPFFLKYGCPILFDVSDKPAKELTLKEVKLLTPSIMAETETVRQQIEGAMEKKS